MQIDILTNFERSCPEYSLYSVVLAQADAIARQGNDVKLHVLEDYEQQEPLPRAFSAEIVPDIPKIVTRSTRIDYRKKEDISEEHLEFSEVLKDWLLYARTSSDIMITHDWILTGWNLPYYLGLEKAAPDMGDVRFFHWIHSIPSGDKNWWYLRKLGHNRHRIVYPNKTAAIHVANAFSTTLDKVLHIPHIVDLRDLFNWDIETCALLDDHPELMESQVVQVYPASSDRMEAKRVRELILLFAEIKRRGFSVCLWVANQNADNPVHQESIDHLIRVGKRNGLVPGEDLVFTSEHGDPRYRLGLPKNVLISLMQCSNVFVFPSIAESFGLVLPECVLASGALPMLNKSLGEMVEIGGARGLIADFGSYSVTWEPNKENEWIESLAGLLVAQLRAEEGVQSRTWFRRNFNKNTVYHRYYVPAFEGAALW